jgi:hypothetical protein
VIADRTLELGALLDLQQLLEGMSRDLEQGRISRHSWTQALTQCQLRVTWLRLRYQPQGSQLQDLVQEQKRLQSLLL